MRKLPSSAECAQSGVPCTCLGDGSGRVADEHAGGLLRANTLHEAVEGLPCHGAKDAMEMVRREAGHLGQGCQRERLVEVALDVVDDAVDACHVRRPSGGSCAAEGRRHAAAKMPRSTGRSKHAWRSPRD